MPETIITRLRKEKKLTQAQLAEKAGMHVQALAKLERGERPIANLRFSTALALADALQVDPHQLLG
jgi:transcriptional regulator with XRE-family HTH domain